MELTNKQKAFSDRYVIHFNATRAAIEAGYSSNSARSIGCENLTKPYILNYIDNMLLSVGITKHFVLKRLFDIANSDLKMLFHEDGTLKHLHELTGDESRTISSFKVSQRKIFKGKEVIGELEIIEVKFWDKIRALENLGKYFKLFSDKVESKSNIEAKLEAILSEADEIAERYFVEARKAKEKEAEEKKYISDNSNI